MVVQWNVILLIIKSRPAIYYIQIVYNKKLLLQHPKINASGITYDEIDKATLRLNVFYETMTYTSTTESAAVTTETFISNLGGTLGLFIGISILSFVELVELAVLLLTAIVE